MKLHFPIGIEIESGKSPELTIPNVNRQFPSGYSLGTDNTSGWEARSVKFEDSEPLITDTKEVCQTLERSGCGIHHLCGLHVHVGFKQIGDLSAKYRLFRFVSCYEKLFFELMPPWARRIEYCTKLKPSMWESFQRGEGFNYWKDATDVRRLWFNGAAMHKHGTIEFRHMNGTLNANEILGWVATLQCIFHATTNLFVKLDWNNTRVTPKTLIRDMKASENEIWGRRASNFILSKTEQL